MFYAVKHGRVKGIYTTWELCKEQVTGFKDAQFKKFKTKSEANDYIGEIEPSKIEPSKIEPNKMETTYVYCDGSCIHNGLPNAKAGIGIYFGPNDARNVSESISGNTNNIAELCAMIRVYDYVKGDVTIVSDSKYALLCVGTYGKKCELSGWPDIPNKELVKQLYYTYKDTSFQFLHVYAHTNKKDMHSIGNQHADRLAQDSIKN
jgi:ribonuclease HI